MVATTKKRIHFEGCMENSQLAQEPRIKKNFRNHLANKLIGRTLSRTPILF